MFGVACGIGVIVAGGSADQPIVLMRGDAVAATATNYVHGYTPLADDVVLVLSLDGGSRVVIGVRDGA